MICRHCHAKSASRPRGLCWACFYTPDVRALYPSTSPYARRGCHDEPGTPALEPQPTSALPGTEEKVAVMVQRARDGQRLFHPKDGRRSVA